MKHVVCFTSLNHGVGKTTAAMHLSEREYVHLSFAYKFKVRMAMLWNIPLHLLTNPKTKEAYRVKMNHAYERLGHEKKEYIQYVVDEIAASDSTLFVIDDLRHMYEYEMLQEVAKVHCFFITGGSTRDTVRTITPSMIQLGPDDFIPFDEDVERFMTTVQERVYAKVNKWW